MDIYIYILYYKNVHKLQTYFYCHILYIITHIYTLIYTNVCTYIYIYIFYMHAAAHNSHLLLISWRQWNHRSNVKENLKHRIRSSKHIYIYVYMYISLSRRGEGEGYSSTKIIQRTSEISSAKYGDSSPADALADTSTLQHSMKETKYICEKGRGKCHAYARLCDRVCSVMKWLDS